MKLVRMNAFTFCRFVHGLQEPFGLALSGFLGTLNMPDVHFTSSRDTFLRGSSFDSFGNFLFQKWVIFQSRSRVRGPWRTHAIQIHRVHARYPLKA